MSVIFERKIGSAIEDYFETDDAPILVIDGARQVGKSFIIRELGKRHYKNFVEINMIEDKEGPGLFQNVHTTKDLYYTVQAIADRPLGDYDDTLIFLDEIQEYGHLLTLLKFLRMEHRYKFIVSGSLLGVELRKTSSIPIGSISTKRMFPMDIEEFLWANGIQRDLIDDLKDMIANTEEIPDGLHKRMMDLFKDYLICGGLPYCVDIFLQTRDVVKLRNVQKEIYELYGNDASKYDVKNKMHTKAVFDSIPSSIENKRKRVFAKDIEGKEHARFDDYKDDFDNLVDSGVVLQVTCCSNPVFPLRESSKRNLLKLYICDVGLLSCLLYRNNVRPLREDIPQINLGNVYECVAAMQLSSNGHTLYYCDNKNHGEVDYLVDDYDDLSVKAIEIKSGKDYKRHNAIDKLMDVNDSCRGFVLSNSGNVEVQDRITYLPIYALMFI
ncbi:ATP-binding protein [Methanomethylophilus alvi]|uniref:ATP-binding protein n=1 Tax=Methanomethylophilus alvi TaxID=1291540 RepID=UPI0037DBF784